MSLHNFLFVVYPYICLSVFLMGSLARFDRDQYTWKSDSSQMLRKGSLGWASNMFHAGILFLFMGHTVGMLTPHALYEHFISPANKQMLAMVAGGIAGVICFIGLTGLIVRRMSDPRIRLTSHRTDLAILLILWVQLSLGLLTLPASMSHADGSVMLQLSDWAQRIVTFNPDAAGLVNLHWTYKVHMVLGMTIFFLFPFSRLVHVWSGLASIGYVLRPYQVVRSRRMNLPQR
ncbi:respiratory nitrate reductase subunit gamma [Inhella gelatinilytica]|uniref:nitrate reductase (quinone) n=1 Tax=Inhella gelatinilytica TaxID=2795030 RepID=A0A931IU99_9BURK|nr:respiratory nitrate reductase subunit gamma [Inhella gelatinilytica]MBH9552072.1 respiratory nitrate reductase subunit gamma [Inhella gelatinilytica]